MSAGGPGIGDWQSMAEQAVWDMNSARGRIEPIVLNPDKSYAIEWLKAAEADLTSARHKLVQAILMAEGGRV